MKFPELLKVLKSRPLREGLEDVSEREREREKERERERERKRERVFFFENIFFILGYSLFKFIMAKVLHNFSLLSKMTFDSL